MKVYVQNRLEPSSGILLHYHLTRGSRLTSQDYNPSSAVFSMQSDVMTSSEFGRYLTKVFPGDTEEK